MIWQMPHAPKHLQLKTRQWWMDVVKRHNLTEPQRHILTLAGEAWDRSAQARRVLERDGLVFLDRFGQPRPRPEVAIEKDAKLLFARLTRELQLDAGSLPEWFSRLKVVE